MAILWFYLDQHFVRVKGQELMDLRVEDLMQKEDAVLESSKDDPRCFVIKATDRSPTERLGPVRGNCCITNSESNYYLGLKSVGIAVAHQLPSAVQFVFCKCSPFLLTVLESLPAEEEAEPVMKREVSSPAQRGSVGELRRLESYLHQVKFRNL